MTADSVVNGRLVYETDDGTWAVRESYRYDRRPCLYFHQRYEFYPRNPSVMCGYDREQVRAIRDALTRWLEPQPMDAMTQSNKHKHTCWQCDIEMKKSIHCLPYTCYACPKCNFQKCVECGFVSCTTCAVL
jgi:hypothetical protein